MTEDKDLEDRLERQIATALGGEPQEWGAKCLDPDRIIALAERSVPESEAQVLMAHVALCSRCRREYAETVELVGLADEVRVLETRAESPAATESPITVPLKTERPAAGSWWSSLSSRWGWRASPGLTFSLGAALSCAVLAGVFIVLSRNYQARVAAELQDRDMRIANAQREKSAVDQELASLRRETLQGAAELAEMERLRASVAKQTVRIARLSDQAAALREMTLPTPEWLGSPELGTTRGGPGDHDPSLQIGLVGPVNTAVADRQPELVSRTLPGADDYQVSLEMEGSNEQVLQPKRLGPARWKVVTPLRAGKIYQWAVTARRGAEQLRSRMAKFYVLSDAEQQELEAGRRNYARNPLALGALYARLGMFVEAEQQLRSVERTDADLPVVKRWLEQIKRRQAAP